MTARSAATSYDEIPYPSSAIAITDPNRVGAMARLYGLASKIPSAARVLELGCYNGSNLLPLAARWPAAGFVGIDLSAVRIAEGRAVIAATGLKNIELRHQDIMDFPSDAGEFDYILAHGVYSWVPDAVREKILAIVAGHLSAHGVAFVSYNPLPGGSMRRDLRELLLFHTREFDDSREKVRRARALLKFLEEATAGSTEAQVVLLRGHLRQLDQLSDGYLRHEYFSEHNGFFYPHEFEARIARHGLRYVGEAALPMAAASQLSPGVYAGLARLGVGNLEGYADYLRYRTFSQALLCRDRCHPAREVDPAQLSELSFSCLFRLLDESFAPADGVPIRIGRDDAHFNVTNAMVKAACQVLAAQRERAIHFPVLLETARAQAAPYRTGLGPSRASDEIMLRADLLTLCRHGWAEVYVEPMPVADAIPVRPHATALGRYEATHAEVVTNRLHHIFRLTNLERRVLERCDGRNTPEDILRQLQGLAEAGIASNEPTQLAGLRAHVMGALEQLARHGLVADAA